jgi:hypothetical protein
MAETWSDGEIDLIVADYFAMLAADLSGAPYSKAEHNRALQTMIARGRGSIEFKHQNISAVLLGLGQPWIEGYKPASNFQSSLIDGVLRWLDVRPDWLAPTLAQAETGSLSEAPALWIGPAPAQRNEPPPVDAEKMAAIGRKFDVAERDARNRALGKAGEQRVLLHERRALRDAGRADLAEKVRWSAVQDGDGLGYDIASFEPDGRARLIEVKTTNGWERTPFHITRNELAVAEAHRDDWHLVRLWNFAREPKAFALRPPLEASVNLAATSFLASLH